VLCCAVLCCAVLCCAVLCCAVLCCVCVCVCVCALCIRACMLCADVHVPVRAPVCVCALIRDRLFPQTKKVFGDPTVNDGWGPDLQGRLLYKYTLQRKFCDSVENSSIYNAEDKVVSAACRRVCHLASR
jgi:hypothetical protein